MSISPSVTATPSEPRRSSSPAGPADPGMRARLPVILTTTAQLALLTWVSHRFQIEHPAFRFLMLLSTAGFLAHALLPRRLRMPFFAFLSIAAICAIYQWWAPWLLGLGLLLILLCHLPAPMPVRVLLLVLVGAGLALLRPEKYELLGFALPRGLVQKVPSAVWPILGSMFMFRLIVYLYDFNKDRTPHTPSRTLSYFFLLPNVCFPLFPVVDYKTFNRTYYDRDETTIYQKGVSWIFRGLVHLILYRIAYLYFQVPEEEIGSYGKLAGHMVAVYLLYLKVSGQFHLVVGLLCLFGFNLPETHHLYFLASSFNDFWRRINIYWKDFMMKLFYYPVTFRLKKLGTIPPLVVGTLCVFLCTWLLHSYQQFWIKGDFPLRGPDAAFWGILGVLVVVNSVVEARRGRKRTLTKKRWTVRELLLRAVKTVLMFALLTVLWSLWNSHSIADWLDLWRLESAGAPGRSVFAGRGVTAYVLIFLGLGLLTFLPWGSGQPAPAKAPPRFLRIAGLNTLPILVVAGVGTPEVTRFLPRTVDNRLASIRRERLNEEDTLQRERNYYENLTGVAGAASALFELYTFTRPDWKENLAQNQRKDFLGYDYLPGVKTIFKDKIFHTNRWGMRDRDYDLVAAPGTYRAAVLGSSYIMGSGVANDEGFEWLLEERLNRENTRGGPFDRYELLNFAVGGYGPLCQVTVMEEKVRDFRPNAVWYFAHANDFRRTADHIARRRAVGILPPYQFLQDVLDELVPRNASEQVCTQLLKEKNAEILRWSYDQVVAYAREVNAEPVWIYLPRLDEPDLPPAMMERLFACARDAGFTVVDLGHVYNGHSPDELKISAADGHPNARGHQVMADCLYEALKNHPQLSSIARFH